MAMNTWFVSPPPDFDQLALAARTKRGGNLSRETDGRSVGERTYNAFKAVNFEPQPKQELLGDMRPPRERDWRQIPYAIWLQEGHGLYKHTPLLSHYCAVALPRAAHTRRPLKWGRSVLQTYLQHFNPNNPVLLKLAQAAAVFFAEPNVQQDLRNSEASGLLRLINTLHLLQPEHAAHHMANDVLSMPPELSLTHWQERHTLTAHFWLNGLSRHAFMAALQAPEALRRTRPYIQRMCEWALHDAGTPLQRFRYPICRDEFAYSLLSPWFHQTPPPDIQQLLLSELLRTLGDPRHNHAGWLGVRREAIALASRWLCARTLDAFFEILRHTDDDIGPYRRRFWEAYFHAGHIQEAWIALGEQAVAELQKLEHSGELQYAKILGKIAPNQCVLMLRMGDVLFCDWSHQGRLRAIPLHNKQAPKLYQSEYELFQLRFPTPLDFNQGRFDDPGLLHFDSQLGGWQEVARTFIAQHVGVAMSLSELLPSEST